MERIGVVIVFKGDVTAVEAAVELKKIAEVVDAKNSTSIRTFEDEDGGPVWYVP